MVEAEAPEVVILGKQAIDDDCNQTGQMLAALLGWSQATFASKLDIQDGKALVEREVDGGLQSIEVTLPTVVTSDLRLNEPRFASLPNIMKAKKKPLEEKSAADFGVSTAPRLKVLKTRSRAAARPGSRSPMSRSLWTSCATKPASSDCQARSDPWLFFFLPNTTTRPSPR